MRIEAMTVGIALAATLAPGESARGKALVQSMADPTTRDSAYCALLSLRLYHRPAEAYSEKCSPVTDIITAPQATGPPLYIVLKNPGYEIQRESIRRGPAGPFTILDSNGYIVPVFWSANMVIYQGEVFAYSPHGQIAIGQVIGVDNGSAFDAGHWSVQTLHVVPTTVSQKSALSVLIGPPTFRFDDDCAGNFWSWRYRDVDADGFPEIQIGPRADADGNITPTATFHWSDADQ